MSRPSSRRPVGAFRLAAATLAASLAATACADAPGAPAAPIATGADTLPFRIVPAVPVQLVSGHLKTNVAATGAGTSADARLVWETGDSTIATVERDADVRFAWVAGRRAGRTTVVVRNAATGARAELPVVVDDPPPMPWPAVPPASVRVGDVVATAALAVDSLPAGALAGVDRYTVRATLRNTGSVPRTVRIGACPLWVTVHDPLTWYGRPGRAQLWSGDASGACAADSATTSLTLDAGATHELAVVVPASALLALPPAGAGLQFGRVVHFHANLRIDGVAMAAEAGSGSPALPAGSLRVRASAWSDEARVSGPTAEPVIVTQAVITNVGAIAAKLEYGACNVTLLAHRTADRSGPPAWDSRDARPWEGTYVRGCPLPLYGAQLAPGDSLLLHFRETTRLVELLGDSLPDGRYFLTARVRFITPRVSYDADAGALDLALPRPPLASERIHDLVTYRAASAPDVPSRGLVRLTVTATLTHAGGAMVDFPSDCVVRLLAYRDRARRDAAPRSGDADWRQPLAGCAAGTTRLWVNGGQSLSFTTDVAVRDVLAGGLPAGRYHLAALVRAPGRDLYLSAGEIDVAR